MSEDIDRKKPIERVLPFSFAVYYPFERRFNYFPPTNKVPAMLPQTCLHGVRPGYERNLLYANDKVWYEFLQAVGWNSTSSARLPTPRAVGLGYLAPQMAGRMET